MVLLLPERETFGSKFGAGLGQGLSSGIQSALNTAQKRKSQEQEFSQQMNLQKQREESELQRVLSLQGLKNDESNKKNEFDKIKLGEDHKVISDWYGPEIADLYSVFTTGGQTKLAEEVLDLAKRGFSGEEIITTLKPSKNTFSDPSKSLKKSTNSLDNQDNISSKTQIDAQETNIPQMKDGKLPEDYNYTDFEKVPRDSTPKEHRQERTQWRKENDPIYEENKVKLRNNKIDALSTKNLIRMNESQKLPSDLERWLINPETGEFYGYAKIAGLENPTVQEWNKEIARFQNRAKDAFGSRVTNFDLMSYMKQFPGLLNTYEGRKRILEMMEINNKLDNLYDTALSNIYHKYGLSSIPKEQAEKMAQGFIQEETEALRNRYLMLDDENMGQFKGNSKQEASGGQESKRPSLEEIFG